jgi:hypothetical protein
VLLIDSLPAGFEIDTELTNEMNKKDIKETKQNNDITSSISNKKAIESRPELYNYNSVAKMEDEEKREAREIAETEKDRLSWVEHVSLYLILFSLSL